MDSELTMAPEKPEAPSSPSGPTSPCKTRCQGSNTKLNKKEQQMNLIVWRTSTLKLAINEVWLVWIFLDTVDYLEYPVQICKTRTKVSANIMIQNS